MEFKEFLERFDCDNFIYCYDGIFVKINNDEGYCKIVQKESTKSKRDFQRFSELLLLMLKKGYLLSV